jgi:hypothetical protein
MQRDGLKVPVNENFHLLQSLLKHFVDDGGLMIVTNGWLLLKYSRKYMVQKNQLKKLMALHSQMTKNTFQI